MTAQEYSDFVMSIFAPHDDPAARFAHAIMGVCTEVHEALKATDETNALEELGDLLYFTVAARGVLGVSVTGARLPSVLEPFKRHGLLVSRIGELTTELLDVAKRWLAYRKEPDKQRVADLLWSVVELVCQAVQAMHNVLDEYDPSGQIMDVNVRKLRKRYPNGFNTESALNRNLQGELNALKGGQA